MRMAGAAVAEAGAGGKGVDLDMAGMGIMTQKMTVNSRRKWPARKTSRMSRKTRTRRTRSGPPWQRSAAIEAVVAPGVPVVRRGEVPAAEAEPAMVIMMKMRAGARARVLRPVHGRRE